MTQQTKQLLILQLRVKTLDQQLKTLRTKSLVMIEQLENHELRKQNHLATL